MSYFIKLVYKYFLKRQNKLIRRKNKIKVLEKIGLSLLKDSYLS